MGNDPWWRQQDAILTFKGDDLTAGTDLAFRLVDALEVGTARTEPVEIIIWMILAMQSKMLQGD